MKIIVGQTPQGAVSYVSRAFLGKITDNALLECSLFVSGMLEAYTDILGDKGFNNFSILAAKGIGLHIPPKNRKGYEFTLKNANDTRLFANKRIHIERVMSRIKAFSWLKRDIPSSQWDLISDAVAVIAHLCNFQSPLTDTRSAERFDLSDFLALEANLVEEEPQLAGFFEGLNLDD